MIEFTRPVLPKEIAEVLQDISMVTERLHTRTGIEYDLINVLELAMTYENVREWFNEAPENIEDFILGYLFDFDIEESNFKLKYNQPEFLEDIGQGYLNYNVFNGVFTLQGEAEDFQNQTIFTQKDIDNLKIDVSDFERVYL